MKFSWLWLIIVVLLAACSGDPRPLQEAVEANESDLATLMIVEPDIRLGNQALTINPGETVQYSFVARNSNGEEIALENTNRRWTVTGPNVAQISDSGLLRGTASSTELVSVGLRIGGIIAAPVQVRVSAATLLSIADISGPAALTECSAAGPYTATGNYDDGTIRLITNVEWRIPANQSGRLLSSSESVEAEVGALLPGTVSLIAESENRSLSKEITVNQGLESLSIAPENPVVERAANLSLSTIANYTAVAESQTVTELTEWSIEDESVATVSNEPGSKGVLRGQRVGNTQVFAQCGALSVPMPVEVTQPIVVALRFEPDDDPLRLVVDETVQLAVFARSAAGSDEEVTNLANWTIESGEDVVVVGNDSTNGGEVRALRAGRASITASYQGVDATLQVVVE